MATTRTDDTVEECLSAVSDPEWQASQADNPILAVVRHWVDTGVRPPFPTTDAGNRYVLVGMDCFTKWPEAYAVLDQSAITTAEKLVCEMFCRFGAPQELHSDQGLHFGRELRTLVDLAFGTPPKTELPTIPGYEYLRDLQQRLAVAHDYA